MGCQLKRACFQVFWIIYRATPSNCTFCLCKRRTAQSQPHQPEEPLKSHCCTPVFESRHPETHTLCMKRKPWLLARLFLLDMNWTSITAPWGCDKNAVFHMRITWVLRIGHIKDKNQNPGSACLFSYFSPYVTSNTCRIPCLPCYPLTSSCTAISITQHLPDSWWLLRQYLHYGLHCSL